MALLLCLVVLTVALAHGCLHCHSNFSEKFSFYRHHVNLKSWWVGDIPVSGVLLTDWSDDTMKELHLAIPAEISECRSPASPDHPLIENPRQADYLAPPPARSQGEAGPSGENRVSEDGSAIPGEDVLPGPPRLSLTFSCLGPSGYFPNKLRNIFQEQVHLLQNAIIESEQRGFRGGRFCPKPQSPTGLG
ncbi:hypothetical protein P7K49_032832 [Saguinus oedipus]|uniref:Izumo sperm-egg fusion protein 4 n=1 Tax=Saguinus oedipus TaxID=9490 RepID=A0ABQ9TQW7_SAGOE|nr:hypothetical protein P7K49_032832 [Saguinus oedipus]